MFEDRLYPIGGGKVRDPKRIPIVTEALTRLWEASPDLRFWQLITAVEDLAKREEIDMFYLEDNRWLEIIHELTIQLESNYRHR